MWQLLIGVMILDFEDTLGGLPRKMCDLLAPLMASLCILIGFLTPHNDVGFPFPLGLVPVCGATLCILHGGKKPRSPLHEILCHRLMVYIGKISYPIYLVHWPIIIIANNVLPDDKTSVLRCLCIVALTLLLSALTYSFVEQPCRRWAPRSASTIFIAFLIAVGLLEGWLYALRGPLYGAFFPNDSFSQHRYNLEKRNHSCTCAASTDFAYQPPGASAGTGTGTGTGTIGMLPSCAVTQLPTGMSHFESWEDPCWFKSRETVETIQKANAVASCLTPPAASATNTFYLIGDSHSTMHIPGLRVALHGSMNLRYACAAWGCGFLPRQIFSRTVSGAFSTADCSTYVADVFAALNTHLTSGDVVAVAHTLEGALVNVTAYFGQMQILTRLIESRDATLLLIGEPVILPRAGVLCMMSWKTSQDCTPSVRDEELKRKPLTTAHAALHARNRRVVAISYWRLFCGNSSCGAFIPGTQVLGMFDNSHLTTQGSVFLWAFFCTVISDIQSGQIKQYDFPR